MNTETRIVIADDHPLLRQGLRQVIEADNSLRVVAETGDGQSALKLIEEHLPEIAIIDVTMPRTDGFELAQIMRDKKLPVGIIFLTIHDEEDMVNEAMDLGAKGYVLKESAVTDIVACIQAVRAGQHYLSPSITGYLFNRKKRADSFAEQQPRLDDLTPTERRILTLIAEYKTSKEIAEALCISHRTVENHRTNICAKLDLHGSHALIKFALRHKSELAQAE